jgi:SAM-dependent methyltransferase
VASGCCDTGCGCGSDQVAAAIGYSGEDLAAIPAGSNLGLGCGNPHLAARIHPGETVLDLGSGGGVDCFLAARQVGPSGRVIGVDMTPEMVALARRTATEAEVENVSFRLGEIEHLPVADASVDVIISNCVINLAPDKRAVYREAFRVLRPGGRLAIADIVAHAPLPDEVRQDLAAWASCAAGASSVDELARTLHEIGFDEVRIDLDTASRDLIRQWSPIPGLENSISSAVVEAVKPAEGSSR